MSGSEPKRQSGCQVECSGCSRNGNEAVGQNLTGWRLCLSAMGVFLAPLALALAGAVIFSGDKTVQFAGAVGGLTVGLIIAIVLGRFFGLRCKKMA